MGLFTKVGTVCVGRSETIVRACKMLRVFYCVCFCDVSKIYDVWIYGGDGHVFRDYMLISLNI